MALALEASSTLPVISCAKTLFIENVAAFGDALDILNDKKVESDGGTIVFTIDVRRQFMQGNYVMHIVGPDASLKEDFGYKSAILCREDVDPRLIHALLINSNCDRNGKNPKLSKNFINRYDWMHFRNWGDEPDETSSDDSTCDNSSSHYITDIKFKQKFKRSLKTQFNCELRDLTFFVNANRMDEIINSKFTVERDNASIFKIIGNSSPEEVIGFVINTNDDLHTFIGGDWHYACLLTDKNSTQNFAFVFGDLYLHKYFDSDEVKYDIQKEQFTYDIENFLYKK